MKKYVTILVCTLMLLCGCNTNLNNTPTKQAEIFLGKYQTLHKDVLDDLDKVVAEEENFNKTHREQYKSILKKHYQDLEYKIKDEKIDGDKAVVTVEIEVDDYSKVKEEANKTLIDEPEKFEDENGNYNHDKFIEYQLNLIKNSKDRVKYTLELKFTKKNKNWVIENLSETDMDKINGVYNY